MVTGTPYTVKVAHAVFLPVLNNISLPPSYNNFNEKPTG